MIFWDTSALAKCYLTGERHHDRALSLLTKQKGHQASSLIRPEIISAVVRRFGPDRRNRESLLALVEEHLRHFGLSALDSSHIELAVRFIKRHGLRAGDALHLASAVLLTRTLGRRVLRFATADGEQARGAREEGLKVLDLS